MIAKVDLKIPRDRVEKVLYADIGMHFRCTVDENDVYVLTCCDGEWYCVDIATGYAVRIPCVGDTPTIKEIEVCQNERLLVQKITVE